MMDNHRKRIADLEATYVFEPEEREEKSPFVGALLYSMAILGCGGFVGIIYCAVQAWGAVFG